MEKDISASSPNLGGILKAKIEHEKGKTAEEEEMNLGIPPIELEKWDNAKEDWEDFCKDYKEWRNKNGLEIEEENLSKAFERFKQEFSNAASGSGERVRKMSFSGYSPKPISKRKSRWPKTTDACGSHSLVVLFSSSCGNLLSNVFHTL